MARVFCPNCGTEFEVPTREQRSNMMDVTDMNISGCLVSKEIHNNNINKEKENEVMRRDERGRFVKETTNTANKENEMMNVNGIDMNALAKMVAAQIKSETVAVKKETPVTVDGGQWAKNSKYYGKEICGFAYNPYLVRRFLPKQFLELMNEDLNVNESIRRYYTYMDTVKYAIEECGKLSMLQKRDAIAYDERRKFWTESDMKRIFIGYINNCLKYIEREIEKVPVDRDVVYLKGVNCRKIVTKETIINHKLVIDRHIGLEDELKNMLNKISRSYTYKELYTLMKGMELIKLESSVVMKSVYNYATRSWDFKYINNTNGFDISSSFMQGFKKSGAYYTLKDEIMFHNRILRYYDSYPRNEKVYSGRKAISVLRNMLDNGTEDYVFYAILKEMLGFFK